MRFAHFAHVWGKTGMTPAQRYQQLWRELQLCDDLGFDYGFCVEHHFQRHESWMAAPGLYAAAAGALTKRIHLGGMGHIVPLHNPVRLLEELAITDQILDGRLEIGLVPGARGDAFGPFGVDFKVDRREKTLEFVRLLKTAYGSSDEAMHINFDGRFTKLNNLELAVPPAQKPHPSIWMETRDPATLEFCAREGLNTGYFIFLPRKEAKERYAPYLENWKKAGWSHRPQIAYLTLVYVDETDELAFSKAAPYLATAYRGVFPRDLDAAGLRAAQERHAAKHEAQGDHGGSAIARHLFDPEWLVENEYVLVGSPETVIQKLRKWSVEGSFNAYFGEFNFGDMPEDMLMHSIEMFGREVMPALRDFEPF